MQGVQGVTCGVSRLSHVVWHAGWCAMAAGPHLCRETSCTHWTQNLPQRKPATLLLHQWKPLWQINQIQISSQSLVLDGTKVINHQSTSTHQLPPYLYSLALRCFLLVKSSNHFWGLWEWERIILLFPPLCPPQALQTTKLAVHNSTRPTWPDPGSKTHKQQCFTTSLSHWKTIIEWIITCCGCRLELGREKVRAALSQKNIHLLSPTNYHNLLACQLKQWQVSIIPLYSKLPI